MRERACQAYSMTGRTRHPEKARAALGVRSHSGWAAYVVLAGDLKRPVISDRGRINLCDPSVHGSKQPFHQAEPMAFAAAEKFIARCRASTAKLAGEAIEQLKSCSAVSACCVLTASGKPLPDLKSILASHALIHTAEGEFYRNAVAEACMQQKITVRRIRERDIEAELQNLPLPVLEVRARIAELGKKLGPPWTVDEKMAAYGAWLMLTSLPSRRGRG